MDDPAMLPYVPNMFRRWPRWQLLVLSVLLIGGAAIGVGVALPGARDTVSEIRPYDPKTSW
jgi:hypothetical protein